MDDNIFNGNDQEQSRRDFLKRVASITFVGALGLFLGDKAGLLIEQAHASTSCSSGYECAGGGGRCGSSSSCSGQG